MRTKYTPEQKADAERQLRAGVAIADTAKSTGVKESTLNKWRADLDKPKAAGRKASRRSSVTDLDPVIKLKVRYAEAMLEIADLRELFEDQVTVKNAEASASRSIDEPHVSGSDPISVGGVS